MMRSLPSRELGHPYGPEVQKIPEYTRAPSSSAVLCTRPSRSDSRTPGRRLRATCPNMASPMELHVRRHSISSLFLILRACRKMWAPRGTTLIPIRVNSSTSPGSHVSRASVSLPTPLAFMSPAIWSQNFLRCSSQLDFPIVWPIQPAPVIATLTVLSQGAFCLMWYPISPCSYRIPHSAVAGKRAYRKPEDGVVQKADEGDVQYMMVDSFRQRTAPTFALIISAFALPNRYFRIRSMLIRSSQSTDCVPYACRPA